MCRAGAGQARSVYVASVLLEPVSQVAMAQEAVLREGISPFGSRQPSCLPVLHCLSEFAQTRVH